MGHPDFRANRKIFATLYPDGEHEMVKLTPEQQQDFVSTDDDVFAPASGVWGRQGCTTVRLALVDEDKLGEGNDTCIAEHCEGRDRWKVQDETARQSDEETPQAVRPERKTCCLDAPNLICYKNFFASAHGLRLCWGRLFRSSSMAEHPAVNRRVVSSSLTCGANFIRERATSSVALLVCAVPSNETGFQYTLARLTRPLLLMLFTRGSSTSYSIVLPSKCSLSASASSRVWWTTPSRWFGGP